MTISEAIKKHHAIEVELLVMHILQKPKEFLFSNPEKHLLGYQIRKLESFIERREKGEPMAYILEYKDFYGLKFKVNKNVLIPRPETEELVDRVLKICKARKNLKIVDIGTGSGAIIVSLSKALQSSNGHEFHASDISSKALVVAKDNAKTHKSKIIFTKSDLFKNLSGRFDIVIANLPYVPCLFYKSHFANLQWEPKAALVDPVKDFNMYEKFLQQVVSHVNPGAAIYLEMDPNIKPFILTWAKKYLGNAKAEFFKDMSGLWRFVVIWVAK